MAREGHRKPHDAVRIRGRKVQFAAPNCTTALLEFQRVQARGQFPTGTEIGLGVPLDGTFVTQWLEVASRISAGSQIEVSNVLDIALLITVLGILFLLFKVQRGIDWLFKSRLSRQDVEFAYSQHRIQEQARLYLGSLLSLNP